VKRKIFKQENGRITSCERTTILNPLLDFCFRCTTLRIRCDSPCSRCNLEGGPSRDISDQFSAHYCPTCRKAFFCEVGVVQHFSTTNRVSHSCVDCGVPLILKNLDEISMLKARFSFKDQPSGSRRISPRRISPERDNNRLKTLSMLFETKSISYYHRSLIDELNIVDPF